VTTTFPRTSDTPLGYGLYCSTIKTTRQSECVVPRSRPSPSQVCTAISNRSRPPLAHARQDVANHDFAPSPQCAPSTFRFQRQRLPVPIPQLAFWLGSTLAACLQQSDCFHLELAGVLLSRLLHCAPPIVELEHQFAFPGIYFIGKINDRTQPSGDSEPSARR
jgi:hypothetical protein